MEELEEKLYNDTVNGQGFYFDNLPKAIFIIEETMMFIIAVVAITLNLILAVCIIWFKSMQNRLNILLCNVCICNVFTFFFESAMFDIITRIFDFKSVSFQFYCIVYHHARIFYNVPAVLLFMISLDSTFVKVSNRQLKTFLVCLWSFTFLYMMANTTFCLNYQFIVFGLIDLFTFLALNVLIFIRSIMHFVNVLRKSVSLTEESRYRHMICGVYVVVMIYGLIFAILSDTFFFIEPLRLLFKWLFQLYFCQPILYIYILTKYDKNVKMCLNNVFTCNYQHIEANIRYKTGSEEVETLPDAEVMI